MTYVKLLKSIESKLFGTTHTQVSPAGNGAFKVVIHMDPGAVTWNRAAIELSEENSKLPSHRRKIKWPSVVAVAVAVKNVQEVARMSTNDWNDLALARRNKDDEMTNDQQPSSEPPRSTTS